MYFCLRETVGETPEKPDRAPENFIVRLLRETGLSPDLFQAILYKWVCECLSTGELRLHTSRPGTQLGLGAPREDGAHSDGRNSIAGEESEAARTTAPPTLASGPLDQDDLDWILSA